MPIRKKENKKVNPDKEMSLAEHLRELRNRILICIIFLLAAVIVGTIYSPNLVELLLKMGEVYDYHFVYLSPQELLLQYFSIALLSGFCVTLPVIFYQIWAFARPGLKKNENLFFLLAMIFGLLCFCLGVFFAYQIVLPFMLQFLTALNNESKINSAVSVQNYISFLMTIFVIFGMVFELPVISILLNRMGLLKIAWMKQGRKIVIVLIFFIAAVITPPDVISQIMVAIPMLILYEISIILCSLFGRHEKKKE